VLSASGDLPGLRVERDNATPAEWANIRLSLSSRTKFNATIGNGKRGSEGGGLVA
jgi:hypothetical protein